MRRLLAFGSIALVTLAVWTGCGSAGGTGSDTTAPATGAGSGGTAGDAGAGGASAGTGGSSATGGSGGITQATTSKLTGKVTAPEGTIPISGALVYLSPTPPDPIPDGVYCDKCVQLTGGIPFTTTKPDGTFELGTSSSEGYLVVQKGAFRRVRKISVQPGDQQLAPELTRMPAKMDKANGDDVPKIAVVLGAWDPIEIVLARMGLAATITKDVFGKARVLGKDAPGFAIYGVHDFNEQSPYPAPMTLLSTPAELEKYHIVFLPCSGSTNSNTGGPSEPACNGVFASSGALSSTLEGFVKKGGRVYASDWSYEYVRQIFKGFVTWKNESTAIGSACFAGGGDQAATVPDAGLEAWLKAQGKTLDTVKDAWTHVDHVNGKADVDADGKPVTETPKVWVKAASDPASTSFKHGCGRVLYSTYHTQPTSETNGPLEPQALSLLYLILEIGVCINVNEPG